MRATGRSLLAACGFILLGLGALGLFLPLVPTTPFLIAAVACFSRSSPRFEAWLIDHPRLGPVLQGWRHRRAIPSKAKLLALVMMIASFAGLVLTSAAPAAALLLVALVLAVCATYIVSRPSS